VSDELEKLGLKGVKEQRLGEKIRDDLEAPAAAVEYIQKRKPARGYEKSAEVAVVGLLALRGEPLPEGHTERQQVLLLDGLVQGAPGMVPTLLRHPAQLR